MYFATDTSPKFTSFLCRQEQGHRAFFKEVLEILKCHQDVLHGNWQGLLLKYVATYTPKFSDSFAREWLNDEASAFSVARRVLFDYQPGEPEMWLYIFAELFPACRYGGTMHPLLCPWPGKEKLPKEVDLYETSAWRRDDMSFLEFLRKINDKGEIHQWVKRAYKEADQTVTLEAFANSCAMRGERVIACDMLSLFNDRWFAQWLTLRKPFRDLNDLLDANVIAKVPGLRLFGVCLDVANRILYYIAFVEPDFLIIAVCSSFSFCVYI